MPSPVYSYDDYKGDFVIVIISWYSTVILTYYHYEFKIFKFNLMAYNLLLLQIWPQIVLDLASRVSFELASVFFWYAPIFFECFLPLWD